MRDEGNPGWGCPPGTRIRLADGSERPIEDVRLLDMVVTAEATAGRVIQTMVRDEEARVVRLMLWGHNHLRLANGHPETGRLIGLFLAEGSCDPSKARWTFAKHEEKTLVTETVRLLHDEWDVSAHVAVRPNNSINVTLHGTAWARLLSALCGNGSGLKRPHPKIMGGPADFLRSVLEGWLEGDGCVRKDGSREGLTISGELALAMYDIGQAIGHHPVIDWRESPQNSAAKIRRPRWTLTFAPGRGRCRQTNVHVWRKVRALRPEEYIGPIYHLSVEGGSYVAEGVAVRGRV